MAVRQRIEVSIDYGDLNSTKGAQWFKLFSGLSIHSSLRSVYSFWI